jgi:hypothetical protein
VALGKAGPETLVSESDYHGADRVTYARNLLKKRSVYENPDYCRYPDCPCSPRLKRLPAQSGLGCRPAVKAWTPACVTATYVRHALPAYDAAVLEGPDQPLKASYPLPQARQPRYRVVER